jgi:peptidoglycan/LPS O-acetylase OafA/YrhL
MGLQRAGNGSPREYAAYAVRRICRIYPAFFIATLAVLAFLFLANALAGSQFWFNHAHPYRVSVLNSGSLPSGDVAVKNLLLLNGSLNLVTWTLGVEMYCSLLLPLVHYAKVRMPPLGTVLLLAFSGFLIFCGKWILLLGLPELEAAVRWEYLSYFYLFYLGYLLPVFGPKLFRPHRISPRGSRIVFAVAVIAFLSATWCEDTYRVVAGLSAWVMLSVLMYGPQLRGFHLLDHPVVRFYGRISYSFYLLHDLVLITLVRTAAHFILTLRTRSGLSFEIPSFA